MSVSPAPPPRRSRLGNGTGLGPPASLTRRSPRRPSPPVQWEPVRPSLSGRISGRSVSPVAPAPNFREIPERRYDTCTVQDNAEWEDDEQDGIWSASSFVVAHGNVQVAACGSTFELEVNNAQPLTMMQTFLQRELCVHGQDLNIFDAHGNHITSDSDLRAVLCRGDVPLSATLADSHGVITDHGQARSKDSRELCQTQVLPTQWKLMRDEFSGLAQKMLKIGRSVEDLSQAVRVQSREHEAETDRLRQALNNFVEIEVAMDRQKASQLSDRIDVLALDFQGERAIREALKEAIDQTIQQKLGKVALLHEEFEGDRLHNQAVAAKQTAMVEDVSAGCLKAVQEEARAREVLEDRLRRDVWRLGEQLEEQHVPKALEEQLEKHMKGLHARVDLEEGARKALDEMLHRDVWRLSERLEVIAEMQNEKARDFSEQLLQASCKNGKDLQDLTRQMLQVRGFSQNFQTDVEMRMKAMEAGSVAMDNTFSDAVNRHETQFDWLRNRLEKLYTAFEEARIEDRIGERNRASTGSEYLPSKSPRSVAELLPAAAGASAGASAALPASGAVASLAVAANEWQRQRSPRAAGVASTGSTGSSPGIARIQDFSQLESSTPGSSRASELGHSSSAPAIPARQSHWELQMRQPPNL